MVDTKEVIDLDGNKIQVSLDTIVVTRGDGNHLQTNIEKAQRVEDQKTHDRVIAERLVISMDKEQNRLLSETDKYDTLSAKSRMTPEAFQAMVDYRQAVRQVNNDNPDGKGIVWPIKP